VRYNGFCGYDVDPLKRSLWGGKGKKVTAVGVPRRKGKVVVAGLPTLNRHKRVCSTQSWERGTNFGMIRGEEGLNWVGLSSRVWVIIIVKVRKEGMSGISHVRGRKRGKEHAVSWVRGTGELGRQEYRLRSRGRTP